MNLVINNPTSQQNKLSVNPPSSHIILYSVYELYMITTKQTGAPVIVTVRTDLLIELVSKTKFEKVEKDKDIEKKLIKMFDVIKESMFQLLSDDILNQVIENMTSSSIYDDNKIGRSDIGSTIKSILINQTNILVIISVWVQNQS